MEALRQWGDCETEEMRAFIQQEFGPFLRLSLILPNIDYFRMNVVIFSFVFPSFLAVESFLVYTVWLVRNDYDLFVFVLHFSVIGFIGLFYFISINLDRPKMCKMLHEAGTGLYSYDEPPHPSLPQIMENVKREKYFMLSAPLLISSTVFCVLIGPYLDEYMGIHTDTYTESGVNTKLIIPLYLPFPTHEGVLYLIPQLMIVGVAALTGLIIGAAAYTYVVTSLMAVSNIEKLKLSLQTIGSRADARFKQIFPDLPLQKSRKTPEYRRIFDYCFGQNVAHHKAIQSFLDKYNTVAGPLILIGYSGGTLIIALSMIKLAETSGDFKSQNITFASSVMCEVLLMFLLSYYGERLGTLSDELYNEIYSMDWIGRHKSFHLSLLIFQSGASKRLILKAGGLMPCNMETFSTVMNTAYSYFNLLKVSNLRE